MKDYKGLVEGFIIIFIIAVLLFVGILIFSEISEHSLFVNTALGDDTLNVNTKSVWGTVIRTDTVAIDTSASFTPTWLGNHTWNANILTKTTGFDLGATGTRWDAYIRDLDVNGTFTGLVVDSTNTKLRGIDDKNLNIGTKKVGTATPTDQQILKYFLTGDSIGWGTDATGAGGEDINFDTLTGTGGAWNPVNPIMQAFEGLYISKGAGTDTARFGISDNGVSGFKISLASEAAGNIMYFDGTNWVPLFTAGSNNVLHSGNPPSWSVIFNADIGNGTIDTAKWANGLRKAHLLAGVGTASADSGDITNRLYIKDSTGLDILRHADTLKFFIPANGILGTHIGIGTAVGDLLKYDGTDWIRMGRGTADQFLAVNIGGSDLEYKTIGGVANEIDILPGVGTLSIGIVDPLTATKGGTGQSTVTTGDLLYGSASNVWSKLAGVTGLLHSTGAAAPTWGLVVTADITANAVDGTKIQLGGESDNGLMYYNGTDWAPLGNGASINRVLHSGGVDPNAPNWLFVDLVNDITGKLPNGNIANGSANQIKVTDSTGNNIVDRQDTLTIIMIPDSTSAVKAPASRHIIVGDRMNIVAIKGIFQTGITSGDSVRFDFNKNGTTLYSTQNNRPTLKNADAVNTVKTFTAPDVTTLSANDYLTIDVDVVQGSSPANIGVSFAILCTRVY